MSQLVPPDHFKQLFLTDTPFIDVRAEIEYAGGAFPSSCNLPILTTGERDLVGTTYKQQGQAAAVALGHDLVQGGIKDDRVSAWCEFARSRPGTHVYCWRGGLRSRLAAGWMAEAGCDVPIIDGGYKALRQYLMEVTDSIARDASLVVIGGQTGAAKTPLLQELATGIDLEYHANHRGSSFGRHATEPPCQVNFEHSLAIDMLKVTERHPHRRLFFEDESHSVGAVSVPLGLFQAMRKAPLVIVDMPLAFRVERIYQEYVVDLRLEYAALDSEDGERQFQQHLLESLQRIQKRLGLERYKALDGLMRTALSSGEAVAHEAWIRSMLCDYYDPMYQYQLAKSASRQVFRGDYAAVLDWCRDRLQRGSASPD
jgi:tRNA 2-selenouridine synthase